MKPVDQKPVQLNLDLRPLPRQFKHAEPEAIVAKVQRQVGAIEADIHRAARDSVAAACLMVRPIIGAVERARA